MLSRSVYVNDCGGNLWVNATARSTCDECDECEEGGAGPCILVLGGGGGGMLHWRWGGGGLGLHSGG